MFKKDATRNEFMKSYLKECTAKAGIPKITRSSSNSALISDAAILSKLLK